MTPENFKREVAASCQARAAIHAANARQAVRAWDRLKAQQHAAFWAAEARRHMGVE